MHRTPLDVERELFRHLVAIVVEPGNGDVDESVSHVLTFLCEIQHLAELDDDGEIGDIDVIDTVVPVLDLHGIRGCVVIEREFFCLVDDQLRKRRTEELACDNPQASCL